MDQETIEKPRILIVDDEKVVRDAFNEWFSMRGFHTDVAGDGVEAVEKCSANRYDVVTMDLQMPRMTGTEAIRILKRERPNLPIIVVTGFLHQSEESALGSVAKVLVKPVSLRTIEDEVWQALAVAE